jgi:hypothetical protein
MYCCIYASGNLPILLDCARQFSPLIETHSDMVIFDARGLEGPYVFGESAKRCAAFAILGVCDGILARSVLSQARRIQDQGDCVVGKGMSASDPQLSATESGSTS